MPVVKLLKDRAKKVLSTESSRGKKADCSAIYGNESEIYLAATDVALSLIGESAP